MRLESGNLVFHIKSSSSQSSRPKHNMQTSVSMLLSIAILLLSAAILVSRPRRGALPPSPKGWPIIGNLFDLQTKHPWKTYAKLAKEYNSSILSMRVPGATMIILNDARIVTDLFTKRAALYSDRPNSTLFDMMDASRLLVFQSYGERWKHYRRTFKNDFEAETHSTRRFHELGAARRLLARLLTAKDHEKDLRLAAGDAILSVTYGIRPTGEGDSYIAVADEVTSLLADVGRGGFLVDALPFLKLLPSWFPGAHYKVKAARGAELIDQAIRVPFEYVQADMAKGTAVSSVCSRYLASLDDLGSKDQKQLDDMQNIFGVAYLGGADTTVGQLCSFTLAMLLYPGVQKKAQAALDSALNGRLPDFTDYGTIPYVDALVNEVLRWNPMTPLGVPHVLSEPDIYGEYTLPKGAICVANVWAILRDEKIYGVNTADFIPERFLDSNGKVNAKMGDVDPAFGFGRRICPGRVIAREFLWIVIASVLTAYEICDGVDQDGRPLDRDTIEYSSEIISFAPRVKCKFKLRAGMKESIIQDAAEN